MSKRHAIIVLVALSSSSAYSAEYQLTDTRARAILVADVLTAKCPAIPGFEGLITDYRIAASKLLSVASVDTDLYNQRYSKIINGIKGQSESEFHADCAKFIPRISDMIPEMRADYDAYMGIISSEKQREAQKWSNALGMIASTLSAMGQQAQSYNYNFIPIPSGQVNFGAGSASPGNYNHYLVNTPGGQQQCHVSPQGYIFCN